MGDTLAALVHHQICKVPGLGWRIAGGRSADWNELRYDPDPTRYARRH